MSPVRAQPSFGTFVISSFPAEQTLECPPVLVLQGREEPHADLDDQDLTCHR